MEDKTHNVEELHDKQLKEIRLDVSSAFLNRKHISRDEIENKSFGQETQGRKKTIEKTPEDQVAMITQEFPNNYAFVTDSHMYPVLLREAYETLAQHSNFPKDKIEDSVQKALEHEYSHANEGFEQGADVLYGVKFVQAENQVALSPVVRIQGNLAKNQIRDITNAPEAKGAVDEFLLKE